MFVKFFFCEFFLLTLLLAQGFFLPAFAQAPQLVMQKPPLIVQPCGAGHENGEHNQYYPGGALYETDECADGRINGTSRQYYENGQLWVESHYADNALNGALNEYNLDGTLIRQENYLNNQMDGVQRVFNHAGELIQESQYIKGEQQNTSRVDAVSAQSAVSDVTTFDGRQALVNGSVSPPSFSSLSSSADSPHRGHWNSDDTMK